jgi:hypothetical protein
MYRSSTSWACFDPERSYLLPQDLLMIVTNAMRGQTLVVESRFDEERLLSFPFTPGANDFHAGSLSKVNANIPE